MSKEDCFPPSPKGLGIYATFIGGRWPHTNIHARERDAKLSITYFSRGGRGSNDEMMMWKLVNDQWEEVHYFPAGTTLHDLPWTKSR